MRRKGVLLLVSLLPVMLVVLPAQAGGGGHGCAEGFANGTGTTVITEGVCFSPTVLHIEPGDTVEFETSDGIPHTVGGIGGSFGDLFRKLHPGEAVSYRFDEEGTFPYACMLHPGMGGAIVVGDGKGSATAAGVSEVAPPPAAEADEAPATHQPTSEQRPWLVPVAIALGIALLAIAAIPRRRRATSPVL
jgi:plastocyanin